MKDKTSDSLQWGIFVAPLHPTLWLTAAGSIVILAVGFAISLKWNAQVEDDHILSCVSQWFDEFLIAIHSGLMKGHPTEPESLSSRILLLSIYVTCWFVWVSHSTMLTAHLTVTVEKPPFTGLYGLLYNSDYKMLFQKGTIMIDKFKYGSDIERQIIDRRAYFAKDTQSYTQALLTMPKIIGYRSLGSLMARVNFSCSYGFIPGFSAKDQTGMYVQKNSPLKGLFNHE